MMRQVWAVILCAASTGAGLCHGAEVKVEGAVKAIDAKERTLTVEKKTATGTKDLVLHVAEEAGDLGRLKVGDTVTFSYDSTLEVVTKIITPVKKTDWLFYDFMCSGVTLEKTCEVISDSEIRCLPFSPDRAGRPMLVSSDEFEFGVLRCEFYYEDEKMGGNPYIGVASKLPPMSGKTVVERNPKGIEVKLVTRGFGSLLLPSADFKADMVYGQQRDRQAVFPLKQQVPTRNGWSSLEIEIKKDRTILVKGNGVLLNAIANAENTKGHVVVFPPPCDFRLRNVSIEIEGEQKPLRFSSIAVVPCE